VSTKCNYEIKSEFDADKVKHELDWLEREADKVREEMEKRPSKIRHLNDLKRQMQDKEVMLNNWYSNVL
jgi:hypothetical protein